MALRVVFSGEYDVATQNELRRELARLRSEEFLILDLLAVTHIDSTSLGEFVRLHSVREEAGLVPETVLVKPGSIVERIFKVTGLDQVFRVANERPAAARGESADLVEHAFAGSTQPRK